MRTVIIVQARMGSTRLPGKVLMDIEGTTMLERTLERASRATLADSICIATSTRHADDPIWDLAKKSKLACGRGSETDVLDRYFHTAQATKADVIVRITSDCPLIDPEVIDQVIAAFKENNASYASNFLERKFPRGLDVEVFSMAALERAQNEAKQSYEREHVTPYIFEHPELFPAASVVCDDNLSAHRWTVDTEADLTFVRAVYDKLGADGNFTWKDVLQLLKSEPELALINKSIEQKDYKASSHG